MNKPTKPLPPELPDLKEAIAWAGERILGVDPACANVPDISPVDFKRLVDSIRKDGLLFPILVSPEGVLLDGRCRLRACFQLDRKLEHHDVKITEDCPEAIAAANIARRHMTVDQLLMHAAKKLQGVREDALERKRRGKKAGKEDIAELKLGTGSAPSSSEHARKGNARLPKSIDLVAKSVGVSRERLAVAEKMIKTDPNLAREVEIGAKTLKEAVKEAGIECSRKRDPAKASKNKRQSRSASKRAKGFSLRRDPNTGHRTARTPSSIQVLDASGATIVVWLRQNKTWWRCQWPEGEFYEVESISDDVREYQTHAAT